MTFGKHKNRSLHQQEEGDDSGGNPTQAGSELRFAKPIIGLKRDFEYKDLPTTVLHSEKHGKKSSWVADGTSKEAFLVALITFDSHAQTLRYSAMEKIVNLRDVLDVTFHHKYDAGISALGINLKEEASVTDTKFKELVEYITKTVISKSDRGSMIQFLTADHSHRKLPHDMDTYSYWERLQLIRRYIGMMPGAQALPTDQELQIAYFYGQPELWQLHYSEDYDTPTDLSIDELIEFMRRQERSYPQSAPKHSLQSSVKRPRTDVKSGPTLSGSCPFHPMASHSLADCFANPKSDQYDPAFAQKMHEQWQRQNRRSKGSSTPSESKQDSKPPAKSTPAARPAATRATAESHSYEVKPPTHEPYESYFCEVDRKS